MPVHVPHLAQTARNLRSRPPVPHLPLPAPCLDRRATAGLAPVSHRATQRGEGHAARVVSKRGVGVSMSEHFFHTWYTPAESAREKRCFRSKGRKRCTTHTQLPPEEEQCQLTSGPGRSSCSPLFHDCVPSDTARSESSFPPPRPPPFPPRPVPRRRLDRRSGTCIK